MVVTGLREADGHVRLRAVVLCLYAALDRSGRAKAPKGIRVSRRTSSLELLPPMRANGRVITLLVVGIWAGLLGCAGAEVAKFPTEIRLTREDCREIDEKGTFRGVKVAGRVIEREVAGIPVERDYVWNDQRVLSGKKSDIIGWFQPGPQRSFVGELSGSPGHFDARVYQYDLLSHELLRSGDTDVVRAVLWNYGNVRTGYMTEDWQKLFGDDQLALADRLVAWVRWQVHTLWPSRWAEHKRQLETRVELCWRALGPEVQPEHIVHARVDMYARNPCDSAWQSFFSPRHVTEERAERLFLPLVRREYLAHGPVVFDAVRHLCRFPKLRAGLLAKLMEFDAERDRRSVGLWEALDVKTLGDASARRLRAFALRANLDQVAGRGFWAYLATPAGRKETQKDGGKAFLLAYLRVAFARRAASDTRGRLGALAQTGDDRRALVRIIIDSKVDISVTKAQLGALRSAWYRVPGVADYLIVEEEK